ncbi:helix-turn-helix domain-containing protein [Aurantiacibacter hainanensis]|uniref:helix-turn-helix domain-containing protein n=1 Tax=Aurantiacibacter hainanensis TaxID=3076114 RepID=UPI0030C6B1D0
MTDSEDDIDIEETGDASGGVGPYLRGARERKGLTIDQVASETRISRRHLEHIEAGEFDSLPGRTYAIGFTRTYAKTLGLNEDETVAMVREEMELASAEARYDTQARGSFEPGDPSRAPGGRLLYFSLFAVVILLIGIFFAARALFAPAAEIPSLVEQERQEAEALAEQRAQEAQQARAQTAAPQPSGEVVFTAEGEAWVRFYDGEGNVLQEGTLQEGDTFTVPADAQNPQLITGRPDRLAITIGGRPVGKLSNELETVQDVPISAEALLARTGVTQTIGFGLGTPAPADAAGTASTTTAASTQPTAATTTAAPPPEPTPTPTRTAQPTPAQTATSEPDDPEPTPSPAATAPPRAIPAEPDEGGVSPEVE